MPHRIAVSLVPFGMASFMLAPSLTLASEAQDEKDEATPVNIERIQVKGFRWFPESVSMTGQYELNRDFLDFRSQGNGNITDMLSFLPGVQVSETSFDIDRQAEIRSQLLSISGAEPWQTGFFFDGMSNNSRIDPDAAFRSTASVNDVQGHPQNFFINQALVGQVSVYDSNIPVKYSGFNGGVVDVESRDLRTAPRATISYRRSLSDWNTYNYIDKRNAVSDDEEAQRAYDAEDIEIPNFAKETMSVSGQFGYNSHQFLISLNRTTSTIGEISLLQPVTTQRESISSMLKYQYNDGWLDSVNASLSYSPYTGTHLLTDVLNSRYTQEGGGVQANLKVRQRTGVWDLSGQAGYSVSDNSRNAPNFYRPWYRAPGKNWGVPTNTTPLSNEGGYADLNKEQRDFRLALDAYRDSFMTASLEHSLSLGASINTIEIGRQRPQAAITYNAPFRTADIDCRGQFIDCIEQSYYQPLEQLAAQFGGTLDLSDAEVLQAYQDNVKTRGQFFRYRRVYPMEDISVVMNEASAYIDNATEWQDVRLRIGLRADYNDFLQNIDVAPRLQLGWDVWGNNESLLVFGANRYYASNLATYKLREARRPYLTQLRPLNQGVVGDWMTSAAIERFKYRFNDVSTPYNDELSIAYKQRLFGGVLSLKGVHRWKRNQLARGDTVEQDGFTYIYTTNEGRGSYERLTLSYQYRWREHEAWFHTSWSNNYSTNASYDNSVENVPEDEIVALGRRTGEFVDYELMSQDDLTRLNADYSRPLTANLSVHSQWTDALRTSVNVSYQGAYTSAVPTNLWYVEERADLCSNCADLELSYPVFFESEMPHRTQVSSSIQYQLPFLHNQLTLTAEIDNLFNQRTHMVADGQAGIETGRSFWFGMQYRIQ